MNLYVLGIIFLFLQILLLYNYYMYVLYEIIIIFV